MAPITLEQTAANAYRALGISASANEAAIELAARKMRLWPDSTNIPPTLWDLPELGVLSRSRMDINRAVLQLSNPQTRLHDRLLWYHGQEGPSGQAETTDGDDIVRQHDLAIALLHAALIVGEEKSLAKTWTRVVSAFDTLAGAARYVEWLAMVEEDGGFDKRATRAEIVAAARMLPEQVAVAVIAQARRAMDLGDLPACEELLAIVARRPESQLVEEARRQIIGFLEDTLETSCREMDTALRDRLLKFKNPTPAQDAVNYEASATAAAYYNASVEPVLGKITVFAKAEEQILARANDRCVEVLALLALGWEWAQQYAMAEETLLLALGMTENALASAKMREDLERCRRLKHELPEMDFVPPALNASGVFFLSDDKASRPAPAPLLWKKPRPRRRRFLVVATAGVLLVLIVGGLAVSLNWNTGAGKIKPDQAPDDAVATPPDLHSLPAGQRNSIGEINREP